MQFLHKYDRRELDSSETRFVECSRAAKTGKHPVTIVYRPDHSIVSVTSGCDDTTRDIRASIKRLGGGCCYSWKAAIQRQLKDRNVDAKVGAIRATNIFEHLNQAVMQANRLRSDKKNLRGDHNDRSEEYAAVPLLHALIKKQFKKISGVSVDVNDSPIIDTPARILTVSAGGVSLAAREGRGRWQLLDDKISQVAMHMGIAGRTCTICEKKFQSVGVAEAHCRRKGHAERTLERVSMAVAFLNRAHRRGLEVLRWL